MAAAVRRRRISRRNARAMREGIALARVLDYTRDIGSPLATSLVMGRVVDLKDDSSKKVAYAAFVLTNNRLVMDRAFSDGEASK